MALGLLDDFEQNWTFLVDLDRIGIHRMTLILSCDDHNTTLYKKVKTHSVCVLGDAYTLQYTFVYEIPVSWCQSNKH